MAILDPEHLFEQALRLIAAPSAGPPRQVDVRRAISSAYYAVFHATSTAAADAFVGITKRGTAEYSLVYRTVGHRSLRELCVTIRRETLPQKYKPYQPPNGFGTELQAFAGAVVDLQEKRHAADYDPMIRVKTSDASLAIRTARLAVARLDEAPDEHRKRFLTLLLFPPR